MSIFEKLMDGDTSVKSPNGRINFTLKDLLMQTTSGLINLSPEEYQRYFRASKEFVQQLAKSIFCPNIIIPEMTLRFGSDIPRGFRAEVMDGQQRSTSFKLFYENEFPLPNDDELEYVLLNEGDEHTYDLRGKYFKQLPKAAREHFENYELTAQAYVNINTVEAGNLFVFILNNVTQLVAQEKRQAISSPMSRFIQEKARFNPYPVFETTEEGGMTLTYLHGDKAKHTKLNIDQTLAEILYMTLTDDYKTKGVTNKCIDNFYVSHATRNINFNHKHVDKLMAFVNQSMRGVPRAKQMISPKMFRNFCVLVSEHFKANIKLDPINFMNVYIKAINNLTDKKLCQEGLAKTPYEVRMSNSAVNDTIGVLDMLRTEMTKLRYQFIQLDSERTFSRDVVKKAYYEQDCKCNICGEEMPEFGKEIHGDHILLYKDGNPTTSENCAAVHASCNLRKSA
jgi:hypothetical protein